MAEFSDPKTHSMRVPMHKRSHRCIAPLLTLLSLGVTLGSPSWAGPSETAPIAPPQRLTPPGLPSGPLGQPPGIDKDTDGGEDEGPAGDDEGGKDGGGGGTGATRSGRSTSTREGPGGEPL